MQPWEQNLHGIGWQDRAVLTQCIKDNKALHQSGVAVLVTLGTSNHKFECLAWFKAQLTTGSSSQSCSLFYCRNGVTCYTLSWGNDNPENDMTKRNEIVNPYLFPSRWPSLILMGKSGRATAIYPAHPFLPSAGAPCTSCRSELRSSWPLCRSLCAPLHPKHISEITGQRLAQKVLTTIRNFCPCWPCSREYKHHVFKGQFRSSSLGTWIC